MNPIILSDAILALGGTNFSVRDIDTIKYHDGNSKNITKEQIQAKYDELFEADKKLQYQRDRLAEYPNLQECIHALLDGGDTLTELQTKRSEIKQKYPKQT